MTTLIPQFDLKNGGSTPTGAVNRPINEKLAETISVLDFGADNTGVADSTTAINNALAASNQVYFPVGTYLTTGNHVITNQTVIGAGKATTIIKRSTGGNAVFHLNDNGEIQELTVDGNSTWGNGIEVSTTTYGQTKPSIVNTVIVKNVGTTATPTTITAITNASQCQITAAGHGLVAGDYVNIRSVVGLVSTGNPTKSVVSGLWKVVTATTNTFTINLDTTSWTSYTSGGQALKTSFGICVTNISGGGSGNNKTLNNIELINNDNHIYFGTGFTTTFNDVQMFGSNSRAAIYIYNADTIWFNNTYLEGAIETFYYGVRDLTFTNTYLNIQSSNTYSGVLISSIGMNSSGGNAGGEVASLTFKNLKLYRLKNLTSVNIFEINSYQSVFDNIHIRDTASSATWPVFAIYGIQQWSLKNLTIESTNAWTLFDATWNQGSAIFAENINYTQGVAGTCVWPNNNAVGTTTAFISVNGSNCNQSIKSGASIRGYWFQNINGTVDLTNVSVGGSFLYNVTGTVTDPNKAVSINITSGVGVILNTQYVYANNAAAVAGGLAVGTIYQTATGTLQVVY